MVRTFLLFGYMEMVSGASSAREALRLTRLLFVWEAPEAVEPLPELTGLGACDVFVLLFGILLMAAVDNLVYISIHNEGDSLSLFILGGIELVCFVICFLYYQGIGNFAMTLCAVILVMAAEALKLEEAVRYLSFIGIYAFNGYYFVERLSETLLAVESLLLVFAVKRGYIQKRK